MKELLESSCAECGFFWGGAQSDVVCVLNSRVAKSKKGGGVHGVFCLLITVALFLKKIKFAIN